jgi:outer membrane biosynthesis protein TonB
MSSTPSGLLVISPSGIDELDEEALRAFWAAAPFRDPPVSLFEGREHVTFPFGFYFGGDRHGLSAPEL